MFDNELYLKSLEYKGKPWYSSIYWFNLRLEWFDIWEMIWRNKIKTASVVLLWCGCENYDDGYYWKEYEPHLARVLHSMWTRVVGVDIGDNSSENFPHEKIDLLEEPEKLITLGGDVDLVFDGRFSETQNMCPVLNRRISLGSVEKFQERLKQQVCIILKTGWVYVVSGVSIGYDYVWQKQRNWEMKLRWYTTDGDMIRM